MLWILNFEAVFDAGLKFEASSWRLDKFLVGSLSNFQSDGGIQKLPTIFGCSFQNQRRLIRNIFERKREERVMKFEIELNYK